MFEVLVREAAARYGLGDKALPMLQLVLHRMVGDGARGLATFLEKFKTAGLGPIVQSWLGGGPVAKPISNAELDQAVGGPGELIDTLTRTLGADRENITSALGYMLPALVGKLTPGGSLPSRIPPEVQTLAAQGGQQLQSATTSTEAAASTGRAMRWLPWIVVAVIVILALGYCSTRKAPTEADSPAVSEPAAPAPESETPAPAVVPAPEPDTATDDAAAPAGDAVPADDAAAPAPEPDTAADDAAAPADDAVPADGATAPVGDAEPADDAAPAATAPAAEPEAGQDAATTGATDEADAGGPADEVAEIEADTADASADTDAVEDGTTEVEADTVDTETDDAAASDDAEIDLTYLNGRPVLKVFFATGAATVPADFADSAQRVRNYLDSHENAEVQVSGFTDASGDAQRNEALAKERAQAVLAALVMAGVDESRITLEKPEEVIDADEADAAAGRRVEVTVR